MHAQSRKTMGSSQTTLRRSCQRNSTDAGTKCARIGIQLAKGMTWREVNIPRISPVRKAAIAAGTPLKWTKRAKYLDQDEAAQA
mmetsp:Transcript_72764/g.170644  ORF Transcript_72764/g.170644 Transcript_72764/m.170644 type:complete len:84 (-) Transcript_72764:248-499(-)